LVAAHAKKGTQKSPEEESITTVLVGNKKTV